VTRLGSGQKGKKRKILLSSKRQCSIEVGSGACVSSVIIKD